MILLACWICVAQGTDDVVSVVASAYSANRAHVTRHGSLRFRERNLIANGEFDKFPESFDGISWEVRSTVNGRYLFDGHLALMDHAVPTPDLRRWLQPLGPRIHQYLAQSFRALTDGTTSLIDYGGVGPDGEEIHTAKLEEAARRWADYWWIPLSPAVPSRSEFDLEFLCESAKESDSYWKFESVSESEANGQSYVKLSFVAPGPSRLTYWVDLGHGALPRRIRQEDRTRLVRHFDYDDIRRVAESGWYPFRRTEYSPGIDREAKRLFAHEITITEADFSKPPAREEFRIEFPTPVHLIHNQRLTVNGPRQVWDLDAISGKALAAGRKFTMPAPVAQAPVMPGARPAEPSWVLALWVVGIGLVAAGGFAAWRRMRHAA